MGTHIYVLLGQLHTKSMDVLTERKCEVGEDRYRKRLTAQSSHKIGIWEENVGDFLAKVCGLLMSDKEIKEG